MMTSATHSPSGKEISFDLGIIGVWKDEKKT